METIGALGVDALVIRHGVGGLPSEIAHEVGEYISVINAGDGPMPTPLKDCLTLTPCVNTSMVRQALKHPLLSTHRDYRRCET